MYPSAMAVFPALVVAIPRRLSSSVRLNAQLPTPRILNDPTG